MPTVEDLPSPMVMPAMVLPQAIWHLSAQPQGSSVTEIANRVNRHCKRPLSVIFGDPAPVT
jgi:hypothetical protein